jgi:thiamine biosynthesis lipoprotein
VKLVLAGRRPWFCDHSPDPSANWSDLEIDGSRARASRPLALDLGGVAKGFAVDLAAEIISAHGCSGIVNAGGDLRFIGGEERRISLRKPGPEGGFLELGEIPFPALATTASYGFSEDGANLDLIDPLAGKTPTSGFSITVFAENCALADAMTKAVLNLPDAQAADLLRRMNCSSLILESDGRLRELP